MMKLNIYILTMVLVSVGITAFAQELTQQTFKDTRVINTHSVETLPKRKLDIRIVHRFGDLVGTNGGSQTFFGLENASDVVIGAEYGATNNLTVGLYRAKGAGSLPDGSSGLRQLLNGIGKYRILRQRDDGGMPISMTFLGVASMSTAKQLEDNDSAIRSFPQFSHRLAFATQLLIARKFSDGFFLATYSFLCTAKSRYLR